MAGKRQRDQKNSGIFREDKPEQARRNCFLCKQHLTEEQLKPFLKHAEVLQKQYPSSKADFHEAALDDLIDIKQRLLNPTADQPSTALTVKVCAEILQKFLGEKLRESRHDYVADRLVLYTMELQLHTGQWMSREALTAISKRARKVRELWRQQGELLNIAHALLVDVEINRIQYFATSRTQFLEKARTRLDSSEFLCDLALPRYIGEQKQLAYFLRFYVEAVRVQLAFDAREFDKAARHLQSLRRQAAAFTAAYSTEEEIGKTVKFIVQVLQAVCQVQQRNFDCAWEQLTEVETLFSSMQWHPFESQHYITHTKAALALADNDPEYERHVDAYLRLINLYPSFEYRHNLRELKGRYPNQVPAVELLTLEDNSLFVDTIFAHIHPFAMHV